MSTPVSAALDIIRTAKAGDVAGDVAVELATVGLDADALRSVLILLHPFLAEFYEAKRHADKAKAARDRQTLNELERQLTDIVSVDPRERNDQ